MKVNGVVRAAGDEIVQPPDTDARKRLAEQERAHARMLKDIASTSLEAIAQLDDEISRARLKLEAAESWLRRLVAERERVLGLCDDGAAGS